MSRSACNQCLKVLQLQLAQVRRSDEQERFEDGPHYLLACAGHPIAPLEEQFLHAFGDGPHILAAEYLAGKTHIDEVITLEAVQVREATQQIGNRHDLLTVRSPPINRVNPLLGCPRPKRSLALCRLPKKEQQHISAFTSVGPGIVQSIINRLDQSVEDRAEIHRSSVTIK